MIRVAQVNRPRSLKDWFAYRDKISFSPSYQRRGNLWSMPAKRLLINTILNNFDFPKIYFADFSFGESPLNEERKIYAIIDGKQRLSTIFSFFEDEFKLDSEPVIFNNKTYDLSGLNYTDLSFKYPVLSKVLDSYTPTVMSVVTDEFEAILQMFTRLNSNTPVSGPEKRNAMPGPMPILYRDVATHPFIKSNCSFSVIRGQDQNLAAKLIYMEFNDDIVSAKKVDLDAFTRRNSAKSVEDFKSSYLKVESCLSLMTSVFSEKDKLLKSQSVVPIYYWFVRNNMVARTKPKKVYDFLNAIEKKRRLTKDNIKNPSPGFILEESMVQLNSYYRSPEDKSSIESIYQILLDQWSLTSAI